MKGFTGEEKDRAAPQGQDGCTPSSRHRDTTLGASPYCGAQASILPNSDGCTSQAGPAALKLLSSQALSSLSVATRPSQVENTCSCMSSASSLDEWVAGGRPLILQETGFKQWLRATS